MYYIRSRRSLERDTQRPRGNLRRKQSRPEQLSGGKTRRSTTGAGMTEFDSAGGGQSNPGEQSTVGVIGKPSPASEDSEYRIFDNKR